jgi:hypothetical protein
MTVRLPAHARVPRGRRRVGGSDLLILQRASVLIDELGADLDERIASEALAAERLRLLRATTARITRTANDAIQAYARARRALDAEIGRGGSGVEAALATRGRLGAARLELLRALASAGHRYPPSSSAAHGAGVATGA